RPDGGAQALAPHRVALRGPAVDAADLRHRGDDERRLLSDLHVCGAAPQPTARRIGLSPRQHTQSDRVAHRQATRRLALRSHGQTPADDHPHHPDNDRAPPGVAAAVGRLPGAVLLWPDTPGRPRWSRAWSAGSDARRDLSVEYPCDLDELRL